MSVQATRRYPNAPYHAALIRAFAAKHGLTIGHLAHDEYTGMWHVTAYRAPGSNPTSIRIHEPRVLDVIREIKELAR